MLQQNIKTYKQFLFLNTVYVCVSRNRLKTIIKIPLSGCKWEVTDISSFGNLHPFEKRIEVKNLLNELAASRILLLHR